MTDCGYRPSRRASEGALFLSGEGRRLRRRRWRVEAARDQDRLALYCERLGRLDFGTGCKWWHRQDKRCAEPAGFATSAMPGGLVQVLIVTAGQTKYGNSTIRQSVGCKIDLVCRPCFNRLVRESNEYESQCAKHAHRQSPIVPSLAHQRLIFQPELQIHQPVVEIYAAKRQLSVQML
jgi:hypothetical protein